MISYSKKMDNLGFIVKKDYSVKCLDCGKIASIFDGLIICDKCNKSFKTLGSFSPEFNTLVEELKRVREKMEITPKKAVEVPDVKHTGIITKVEERTEPFHYVDVFLSIDGIPEVENLKWGAPYNPSLNGKLLKTLSKFGTIEAGKPFSVELLLVGRRVEFMTITEDTENGRFARVVDGSLRPFNS